MNNMHQRVTECLLCAQSMENFTSSHFILQQSCEDYIIIFVLLVINIKIKDVK